MTKTVNLPDFTYRKNSRKIERTSQSHSNYVSPGCYCCYTTKCCFEPSLSSCIPIHMILCSAEQRCTFCYRIGGSNRIDHQALHFRRRYHLLRAKLGRVGMCWMWSEQMRSMRPTEPLSQLSLHFAEICNDVPLFNSSKSKIRTLISLYSPRLVLISLVHEESE